MSLEFLDFKRVSSEIQCIYLGVKFVCFILLFSLHPQNVKGSQLWLFLSWVIKREKRISENRWYFRLRRCTLRDSFLLPSVPSIPSLLPPSLPFPSSSSSSLTPLKSLFMHLGNRKKTKGVVLIKDIICAKMGGKVAALWQNFDVPEIAWFDKELTFFGVGQTSIWVLCYFLPEWLWVDHLTPFKFRFVTYKGREFYLLVSLLTVRDDLLKASDCHVSTVKNMATITVLWLFPPIYLPFFLSVSFFFRFLVPFRLQFLSGKYIISELTETHWHLMC